jgi:hypothetical protein
MESFYGRVQILGGSTTTINYTGHCVLDLISDSQLVQKYQDIFKSDFNLQYTKFKTKNFKIFTVKI